MDIQQEIAKKYGMKVIHVKEGDEHCEANGIDTYINKSYSCGNTIYLGIYQNSELKLLSFFHEVGHWIDKNISIIKYEREKKAWKLGYKLAKQYGVFFSDRANEWANKQLNTYKSNDEIPS